MSRVHPPRHSTAALPAWRPQTRLTTGPARGAIIAPHAALVILPPLANEFNTLVKPASLLVIISVPELYVIFSRKAGNVFAPFEFFLASAVWYLLLTTIWGVIQSLLNLRLGRGAGGEQAPGLRERLFGGRSSVDKSLVSGGR